MTVKVGLCRTWSETPKTGFLASRLNCGKTFDDMVKSLDAVLVRLQEAGLKLKTRKCQLFAKRVEFLGHVISEKRCQHRPKEDKMCS